MYKVVITDKDTGKSWVDVFDTYEDAYDYAEGEFAYGRDVSSPKEILKSAWIDLVDVIKLHQAKGYVFMHWCEADEIRNSVYGEEYGLNRWGE